ncbi:MAG TPA: hypothetical protein VNK43_01360 [Gemmatimonadales bacterium]|nr:hypothetical protein [Gemmatimonadales bacterium]
MARNQGQEYAEMEDDERRRFALGGADPGLDQDTQEELDFEPDDPRDPDHWGRRPADPLAEQAEAGRGPLVDEADRIARDRLSARRPKERGARRRKRG